MNFDPGQLNLNPDQINQLMSYIPFPIGKSNLIQIAQQYGANEEILAVLNFLPDKTFNSPQDILDSFGELRNFGNFGGFQL